MSLSKGRGDRQPSAVSRRGFLGGCGIGAATAAVAGAAEAAAAAVLRAGAAEADITPFRGCQIDGHIGVPRPMEAVGTPLFARALVLEEGGRRFCLLSLDVLTTTTAEADTIRRTLAEKFGFDRDAIAVHTTQNHSAPSIGQIMLSDRLPAARKYPWLRGSHPDYPALALAKIEAAVAAAVAALEPVSVAWAAAIDGRVAFNRRTIMRDGTAEMHLGPRSIEDVLQREGPSDPEVGVATFTGAAGKPLAALLHHTCHPVHWQPLRTVHADWPGRWVEYVRRDLLPGATPLVVNGCCGNIHHHDTFNPAREDTPESMGRLLTESTRQALEKPHAVAAPRLAWRSETIRIPWREFPGDTFAKARALIEAHPEPMWKTAKQDAVQWDWCFAAGLLDVERLMQESDGFDYEIQAVAVGDLAVLVVPGEPFVEAQLEIKRRSPFARTFVAHMSNGFAGYVPTPAALRAGGYETRPGVASRLCVEALAMITTASIGVLERLAADQSRG
jgi:neutral ceramidase